MKRVLWIVDSMVFLSACISACTAAIYWKNMSMFFTSVFLMYHSICVHSFRVTLLCMTLNQMLIN